MPFGRKNQVDNIKRSSYYVCFIGAKESPVVRDHDYGREFVYPATQYLLKTVVESGPISNAPKITLQVSNKGLKILQNVGRSGLSVKTSGRTDTLKHFVPHHCITCAYQGPPPYDDLVSTILLIFNPQTRCPVHIHVYRCDSNTTAAYLTQQLLSMSERPDNQMKFTEIEAKLNGRGLVHPAAATNLADPRLMHPGIHAGIDRRMVHREAELIRHPLTMASSDKAVLSDGHSSGRTSSSPAASDQGKPVNHRSTSVASSNGAKSDEKTTPQPTSPITQVSKITQEFHQRLRTRDSAPLLLPPKDYDTLNRSRGGRMDISLQDEGIPVFSRLNEAQPKPTIQHSSEVSGSTRRDKRTESIIEALALNHSSVFSSEIDPLSQKKPARKNLQQKKDKKERKLQDFDEIDDDWMVDDDDDDEEEEESTYRDREHPVFTKLSDVETDGLQERLKRYGSLNDVFGQSQKTEYSQAMEKFLSSTPPPLGRAPSVKATSSDAHAAYRPRPYYFSEDEAERSWEQERIERAKGTPPNGATSKDEGQRQLPLDERHELPDWQPRYSSPARFTDKPAEESGTIIQSRHVRPWLPLKQDQRPVINERVRPASFYERVRLDDRDYFEGRFARPEIAYYQYRS